MLRKAGRRPDSASFWEHELKASGEILDLLPIATCICDAAGRIVQYNRRAAELWERTPEPGQTHDDFTAQNRFLTLDGDLLPRSRIAEVLSTGQPIRDEEITVQRVNKPSLVVLLNIDPLFDSFLPFSPRGRLAAALCRSGFALKRWIKTTPPVWNAVQTVRRTLA